MYSSYFAPVHHVDLLAGSTPPLEIEMQEGAAVSGVVRSLSGRPAEGATVHWCYLGREEIVLPSTFARVEGCKQQRPEWRDRAELALWNLEGGQTIQTDAAGAFRTEQTNVWTAALFTALPPGEVQFTVRPWAGSGESSIHTLEPGDNEVEITLRNGNTIEGEGTRTVSLELVPNSSVIEGSIDPFELGAEPRMTAISRTAEQRTVDVGAGGAFAFTELPAGEWRLVLNHGVPSGREEITVRRRIALAREDARERMDIDLGSLPTLHFVGNQPGGVLRIHSTNELDYMFGPVATVPVGETGQATIHAPAPGEYRVSYVTRPAPNGSVESTVLHPHCQAHVAGDAQAAAHERRHAVQAAGGELDVVGRFHRHGHRWVKSVEVRIQSGQNVAGSASDEAQEPLHGEGAAAELPRSILRWQS